MPTNYSPTGMSGFETSVGHWVIDTSQVTRDVHTYALKEIMQACRISIFNY